MASQNIDIIIQAKDQASRAIKWVSTSIFWLKKTTESTRDSFASSMSAIRNAVIAVWGYQVVKSMVTLGASLEQTTIAFTTMLWSAEMAQKTLEDLTSFAAKTPFEVTGIRDTAKQLLAFWFSADELIPTLKSLWDVASGLSVPIEQVAYAYGQVRTANQLYGTELRQFMNAWIPILQELADMYGVTTEEAKKMVENGKVGFKDVEIAFQRMSWEGGTFENMMQAQSASLSWMFSNLKDSITKTSESIGFALIPVLKDLLTTYQPIIEQTWESIKLWVQNEQNINNVTTAIQSLITVIWFAVDVLKVIWWAIYSLWEILGQIAFDITMFVTTTIDLFTKLKNYISEQITNIINLFFYLRDSIIGIWEEIYIWFSWWITSLVDGVKEKLDAVMIFVSEKVEQAKKILSNIASAAKEAVWNAASKVSNVVGARASGGAVTQNRAYLVGENWPELFVPRTSGSVQASGSNQNINISLWNVNVYNEADENRLVDKIKQALRQETKAFNYWIA